MDNNKFCVDCGRPCTNCTKHNNALEPAKFQPEDKVSFIYKGVFTVGRFKYYVTPENCKGLTQYIGRCVVHSKGMSSTLPEDRLTLMKE